MAEMLASFDFYFCRLCGFGLVFGNVVSLFLQILLCISLICQKPTPNPNPQNSSARKSNTELAVLTTASHSLENLSTMFLSASLPWHLENHTWLNIELKRSQTHYSHSFFDL